MYDFSSTAKPASRSPFRGFWPPRPVVPNGAPSGNIASSRPNLGQVLTRFLKSLILWLIGSVGVSLIVSYLAIKILLPNILPLGNAVTFLFVPSAPNAETFTVVFFDPQAPALTQIDLHKSAVPTLQGSLSIPEVNQRLGRVVDHIFILPEQLTVLRFTDLETFLRQVVFQRTFGLSQSTKLKVWLFTQSLPSTKRYHQKIQTASAWQQFLVNSAQQSLKKQCSIALINTTKVSGLGTKISELLEKSGYQIIKVDSQSHVLARSQVHVVKGRADCTEYAQRISDSVLTQPELIEDGTQPAIYRAELVIFVGEDMGRVFAQ